MSHVETRAKTFGNLIGNRKVMSKKRLPHATRRS
jgi:hypothetical protein